MLIYVLWWENYSAVVKFELKQQEKTNKQKKQKKEEEKKNPLYFVRY